MTRGDRAHPDAGALSAIRAKGARRVTRADVGDPVLGIAGPPPAPEPEPAPPPEPKEKIGFYLSRSEGAALRGTFDALRHELGFRSLSDFIAAAVMARVAQCEVEHNGGEPYSPMNPGEIGTGRPLGA